MSEKLKAGHIIKGMYGNIEVVRWLAEGGQGDVYIVNYNGEQKALKWYKPTGMGENPQVFRDNLKENVRRGAPSKHFLWPEDITEWQNGVFGYVMKLRPAGYYEVSEYMLTNVRFSSFKTIVDAALNIVMAYRILHNSGFSYQDLNDGNFFINPRNGKVLICDNDNVAEDKTYTGIKGKPRYMAPEIVTHKQMPDSYSDRFSMSIILFILFCLNHPLEGKRSLAPALSPELQEKLYGSEATFIMENDGRNPNGPDPIIHTNASILWNALPDYMRDLFSKAFSKKAIENPGARPTERVWMETLVRFRSGIVKCQCGSELFLENGEPTVCGNCHKRINVPYKLSFSGCQYSISGLADSRIYACQLGGCKDVDALTPMGLVIAKESDPSLLGVRNMSNQIWTAITPSGKTRKVNPRDVIPMNDGIVFNISNETISIKANK